MFELLAKRNKLIRNPEEQIKVDKECNNLSLYYSGKCPFCLIVKRKIKQLSIDIELVNVSKDQQALTQLTQQGGKSMVPCLKINHSDGEQWLYESSEIISYLNSRFS